MEIALNPKLPNYSHKKLTPRERDCLKHLELGLTGAKAAAALNISHSTFDAHLLSARRKLGVRSTAQALLMLANQEAQQNAETRSNFSAFATRRERLDGLAGALSATRSFSDAWQALHRYAAPLGVLAIDFLVVADLAGDIQTGGYRAWSSLPDELLELYRDVGGLHADPSSRTAPFAKQPLVFDIEHYRSFLASVRRPTQRTATASLDSRFNKQLCIPHRDPATSAPLALVFAMDGGEFQDLYNHLSGELTEATTIFWDAVQRNRLLGATPGFTVREREALTLVARGFSVAEGAGQLGVSVRAFEKFLAGARKKVGARNTTHALYRAIVYRALEYVPVSLVITILL